MVPPFLLSEKIYTLVQNEICQQFCMVGEARIAHQGRRLTLRLCRFVCSSCAPSAPAISGREKARQAKFQQAITKAWEEACQLYLKESRLDNNSAEWKFILDTNDAQQVIHVLTETWAMRSSKDDTLFVGSPPKNRGVMARATQKVARSIGRRESGRILRQPADGANTPQSTIDERSELKQRLSGNPPKGKAAVDSGAELTDVVLAASQSDTLKTIVDGIEKFSDALQNLVSISQVVCSLLFVSVLKHSGRHMFQLLWVVCGFSSG